MNVIYAFTDKHITQLHALYQHEWWSQDRTLDEAKSCVANSTICIGIIDAEGSLVGFTRVLTDCIFKAFIFDVIVHPKQRGMGLGDQLISLVKTHPRLAAVKHFELYCRPGMTDFYARHGFSAELGEIQLMRLNLS